MPTKKRAAAKTRKKRAAENTSVARTLKVSGTFVNGDSPTIGGDNAIVEFEYVLPPDLSLLYADNLNVIHTPTEFVLSFLQTQPPLIKSNADWDNIKTIQSKCIARVVVSPVKMQEILRVMVMNWQRFSEKYLGEGDANATEGDAETSGNTK